LDRDCSSQVLKKGGAKKKRTLFLRISQGHILEKCKKERLNDIGIYFKVMQPPQKSDYFGRFSKIGNGVAFTRETLTSNSVLNFM